MNDVPTSPGGSDRHDRALSDDELDLLASSLLDGESADERDLDDDDRRRLDARIERLRDAVERVRAPVEQPGRATRDEHLAAALAVADGSAGMLDADRSPRPRGRRPTSAGVAVLAIAAALGLVLAGLAWLRSSGGSGTHVSSTAAAPTTTGPGAGAPTAASAGAHSSSRPAPGVQHELSNAPLGAAATPDDLDRLVRGRLAAEGGVTGAAAATHGTASGDVGCRPAVAGVAAGSVHVLLDTTADLAGHTVEVIVVGPQPTATAAAADHLYAFVPGSCRVAVDRPL